MLDESHIMKQTDGIEVWGVAEQENTTKKETYI